MIIIRGYKVILILLVVFIFLSCSREVYNISYTGVIVDEENNCPLLLSAVQSTCLYQHNIDQSAAQKLSTHTDSLGQFHLQFHKGYKIVLEISAEDYVDQMLQFKPVAANIPDTIYLKRKLVFQTSTVNRMNTP